MEQISQALAVARLQEARQAHAVGHLPLRVPHQMAQQMLVQTLADFPVRIAEPVQRLVAQLLFPRNRQVAGLEQQRFGADVVHVERRQQLLRAHLRRLQRVQDRLVVLVDQHRDPLSGLTVQCLQQIGESARSRQVFGYHPRPPLDGGELLHDVGFKQVGISETPAAEAQSHHRMALRPVMWRAPAVLPSAQRRRRRCRRGSGRAGTDSGADPPTLAGYEDLGAR